MMRYNTARLAALILALWAWPAFAQNLVSDQDALTEIAEDDVLYVVDDAGAYDGKADFSLVRSEVQKIRHGSNLQTGTTYELVLADAGKVVELANASSITLTIPASSAVAFPVNTVIELVQGGAGGVTIGITDDTLNGTTSLSTQWDNVLLWKRAATEWVSSAGLTPGAATDAAAIHDDTAAEISAITEKTAPVAADLLLIEDSAASNAKKRLQIGNLPNPTESFIVAASDETSDLETGTAVVAFRMPYALTVTGVRASISTAGTGSTIEADINEGGASILSTVISIDASEETSTTAATPAVISDTALADDAEITIDIDQIGSTTAGAGLKVTIIGYQP